MMFTINSCCIENNGRYNRCTPGKWCVTIINVKPILIHIATKLEESEGNTEITKENQLTN